MTGVQTCALPIYATVGRIADYFETLRAGDESNAIIEAVGAVNLMTIHSAKGLEFPIVFVVNLHVGGRGRNAGFSVIERGPGGEPEVAFLDSPGTELEDLRESEELRRLCYVAVTRARDRLYLAGEIDEKGRLRRRARSLAALLPPGLQTAFADAAVSAAGTVTWTSASGTFDFAVCRSLPTVALAEVGGTETRLETDTPDTVATAPARLVDPSRRRVTATSSAAADSPAFADALRSDRLTGTLVHRLFQRDADLSLSDDELAGLGLRLVRREEAVDETDPTRTVRAAVQAYRRLRARPDVAEWLTSGQRHYEVPFSLADAARPDEIVRGTLDCVVVGPDGVPAVLEFKTGAPRPEHRLQAAIYEQAARAAFNVESARVRLVYLTSGPEM